MVKELVIVRHAQSVGNFATDQSRAGNHKFFTKELRRQKSQDWNLTENGVRQSLQAGEYIRSNVKDCFDQYVTSPFVRAVQTAQGMCFENSQWCHEELVIERNWGGVENLTYPERLAVFKKLGIPTVEDSMDWKPPRGESMKTLLTRASLFLSKLNKTSDDTSVIVVSHGGFIQAIRVILRSVGPSEYGDFVGGTNYIRNCQIFHYFGSIEQREDRQKFAFERSIYIDTDQKWNDSTIDIK